MSAPDLVGHQFGRWTVLADGGVSAEHRLWLCRCECGTERLLPTAYLQSGGSRSCGCVRTTHGRSRTPEYRSWTSMRSRCTNPKDPAYTHYGGRGITVCERWKSFESFFADMGHQPPGHQLDRIDNEKGYQPGNCRWATRSEQARNRRTSVVVVWRGKRATIAEWADALGVDWHLLFERLKAGWSVARTLTEPVHSGNQNWRKKGDRRGGARK